MRNAVTQLWAIASDIPWHAHSAYYVVFSLCASKPIGIGVCRKIETGVTIGSTGLVAHALTADRSWVVPHA